MPSTTENCVWTRVEAGLQGSLLSDSDISTLSDIIDRYRLVKSKLQIFLVGSHSQNSEMDSRKLLLTWVGYCVVFESYRKKYQSVFLGYGACLRYQDLEHLRLSERRLWSVVHRVTVYLKSNFVAETRSSPFTTPRSPKPWVRGSPGHISAACSRTNVEMKRNA